MPLSEATPVIFATKNTSEFPFAKQNITISSPSELIEGLHQIAFLFPERDDGKFYV
jgi:hypothetical protein